MTVRRRDARAVLCVAAVLVSACAIAPGVRVVQAQNAADSSTLTLKQAVALALQNSSDVKVARMQYNVALREAGVDRAAFRPNLYTGAGYAYTYGFPALPGGNAPALFQLEYTQSLFDPDMKSQQHAAEERAKSAKLEIDRIQGDVIVRTAAAYLELAEVRHSLESLRDEQASAEKIIEITHERVEANQELPIEETRSQLALAQVSERTVKLENRDEVLSEQIRDLTGRPDDASIEVQQPDQTFDASLGQQSDSDVVGLVMQNDKTIAEAESDRTAKQELLRGARLSYFPKIDLVGQYSILSKANNYSQFYRTFQRNNVNAGVQISIPLFAAKTSANIALAKSQLQASEATLENKREQVRSGVRQQQQDLRVLAATRETASWALKLAQQTVDVEQSKLQQGQATLGDVEQAQLDENEKFEDYLEANFEEQKGQITLLQATGQLAKVFQ